MVAVAMLPRVLRCAGCGVKWMPSEAIVVAAEVVVDAGLRGASCRSILEAVVVDLQPSPAQWIIAVGACPVTDGTNGQSSAIGNDSDVDQSMVGGI